MTTSPRVRPATEADLASLAAIEDAADDLFAQAGIGPLPPATNDVAGLRGALAVLVIGDPIVGFVRVDEVDGEAHLEQVSVHPSAARRGLGTELLCAAMEWAARAGYESMTLCTFADVPWNAPFYARHGFQPVSDLGPGLAALRRTERRLGLTDLGERVVMRRRVGAHTVVGELADGLVQVLDDTLLGLYVHGSLVMGDFTAARSDLDVLAVLRSEPDERLLDAVRPVHDGLEARHRAWRGRVEVEYVALSTVQAFAADPGRAGGEPIARISPGEDLHLLPATAHRLLTWSSVREAGEPLVGPPARDLLPPLDASDVATTVRRHVQDWPQWARTMEFTGGQVYAVLTMCRAWVRLVDGGQVSKKRAADLCIVEVPEWAELIGWARDWWYADGADTEPARPADCVAFVDDLAARLLA